MNADGVLDAEDIAALAQIRQVLARYCRGIDRADRATLESVYHPGATDNHGPYKGTAKGFIDQFLARVDKERALGDQRCAMHHISNVLLISRTADTAHVESYFFALNPTDAAGARTLSWTGGRYFDIFRCIDGVWKISKRSVVLDFTRKNVLGEPRADVEATYPGGSRSTSDMSYEFIAGFGVGSLD